jgi:hypothetical protein
VVVPMIVVMVVIMIVRHAALRALSPSSASSQCS